MNSIKSARTLMNLWTYREQTDITADQEDHGCSIAGEAPNQPVFIIECNEIVVVENDWGIGLRLAISESRGCSYQCLIA